MDYSSESIIFVNTKTFLDNKTTASGIACSHDQILAVANQAMVKLQTSKDTKQIYQRLRAGEVKELSQALEGVLVSCKTPWNPNIDLSQNPRHQMIFNLMRGKIPDLEEMYKLQPAVLYKKDKAVLAETRELIQAIFDDMFLQIQQKSPPMTESESFHMEMIIGDILSLFPFLRPENGSVLSIPIRIEKNGEKTWKKIDYTVDKISLTPRWMGSPITAYGLHAKKAPPLLLFKGTTYPTDKGFALSLLTDLNPLGSIGSYVFHIGKSNIENWLKSQTKNSKALVYGKSLGGIESCLAAINFPDQIEKVMAYGAPGFSPFDLSKFNQERKKRKDGHFPEINIFCQKNDPAPYCDHVAKKGINYYQVLGSVSRTGVLAHADMYSTHENSMILKLDPSHEAQKIKRVAITTLRTMLSIFAFPFLSLIYLAYALSERAIHHIKKGYRKKPKAIS